MPKDSGNGSPCKKEASPENTQASPKRCSSPIQQQAPTKGYNDVYRNTNYSNDKSSTFTAQFPPSCYKVPSPSLPSPYANIVCVKPERRLQNIGSTPVSSDTTREKHFFNDKHNNMYSDQQIKVLTPSEIMKSLPDLSQDECSFPPRMVRTWDNLYRLVSQLEKL